MANITSEVFVPLKQPLLPLKILKNRNYIAIVIVSAVGQMAFFGLSVIWPEQISALYATNDVTIGWMSVSITASSFKSFAKSRFQVYIGPGPCPWGDCCWASSQARRARKMAARLLLCRTDCVSWGFECVHPTHERNGSCGMFSLMTSRQSV